MGYMALDIFSRWPLLHWGVEQAGREHWEPNKRGALPTGTRAPKEMIIEEGCSRSSSLISHATWSKPWSPSGDEMVQGLCHAS